eukprot:CAMPEP_0176257678 /NCGR_PEP_ID=MMETSP0121_2-20121125/38171_1 /TAXON_ID=160619 /ORGANISM="Kryptoperidinium foliaceum, Strain CCMP 1326" /LENGTH=274 /DNA_ID=CAMNT_0017597525 /DNA_START=81 /DNA_END=905 /DNA_ORIENTATION=+
MNRAPNQVEMGQPLRAQGRELQSGFHVYERQRPEPNSTYEIVGNDFSQLIEFQVHPEEVITCEPGTMVYMSPGMLPDIDMGDCSQGCKRCCCAGESMFRLHFKNEGDEVERVAVTPSWPAQIIPIDLATYDGLIFNRGAFLAAIGDDWHVDIRTVRSVGIACCAGQGVFMNTLHGQGMVFLCAGGTVMTKTLAAGEELVVEQQNILAFEKTVELGIRRFGGCLICCCGGQGLFNAVLTGPGFVMIRTMPLSKLAMALRVQGAQGGGGGGGGSAE